MTITTTWQGKTYRLIPSLGANDCANCAFLTSGKACDAAAPVCVQKGANGHSSIWTEAEQTTKPTNPKDALGVRKAPMSTVPCGVMAELGVALLEGASKYGRHNYRGVGVRASVYYDATQRHLFSWWEGEDLDPDSGLSHVTKAIASLTVLRDAMLQDKCSDDRPPRSEAFYARLNAIAGEMIDKHSGATPHHYTIEDPL